MDRMGWSDLELLSIGGYSPLSGFMDEAEYRSVVKTIRLAKTDLPWSLPITLPIDEKTAANVKIDDTVKLVYNERIYGIITVKDIYLPNKEEEAQYVYQTIDENHPGVKKLYERPNIYLGGPITLVNFPEKTNFPELYVTPRGTRNVFAENKWETIVGFQTRNPIHRAHEYIQKSALET